MGANASAQAKKTPVKDVLQLLFFSASVIVKIEIKENEGFVKTLFKQ